MSGILGGGGKTAGTTVTRYTSLQVQTSAAGVGIPIGWGTNRTGTNLIWYGNFQSTSQSQGGKGGGGGGTSYTYSCAVAMALGEGPIAGIGQVWAGKDATTLADLNLTLMTGTAGQAVLSSLYSTAPDQALAYPLTAYVGSPKYDLGSSASLPNHNFEVMWSLRNAPNGKDANPADILLDLLTNPQYGVGLQAAQVADLTAYRTYCTAAGLFLSPLLTDQNAASDTINTWGTLTNTAIFWSGGQLKAVPLGDRPLTGNGVTWTPDLTPVYDLTDDDFLADSSSGDPVTLNRSDVADSDNIVQLEYLDRSNAYQTAIATARDQSAIDAWGQRIADPTQAHDICDATVAAVAAQLVLQRQLYIRNTYTFKLGWAYGLLEPGDIVTLTDTALGLDKFPVRITGIDEDSDGTLTMTAEELPAGIGTATEYPRPTIANTPLNTSVDPGGVAQAVITEPSPGLTGGVPQVWIGAVGASNWWGGCHVWLSLDDETYKQIGSITEPCRIGTLAAALPVAADPDTSDTAQVTLASPRVQLVGGTQADADAGRTLALIDGEMVAYATATLTGPSTYRLSYLRRGMYGTGIAAHVAGASFARLDDALFRYDLPAAYVGQRLYIKLTSFNLFDAAEQSLADVQAYTYTPVGAAGMLPPPSGVTLAQKSTIQVDGTVQLGIAVTWTPGNGGAAADTLIRWQAAGGAWQSIRVPAGTTTATLGPVVQNTTYTVQAASSLGTDVQSVWTVAQTITLGTALFGGSVSNLALDGATASAPTIFTGPDVKLNWQATYPQLGGASGTAGGRGPYFKDYQITVTDPATGKVVRTDTAQSETYTYTYAMNQGDGGPRRTLTFSVVMRDKAGGMSAAVSLTVTNPVPASLQVQALPNTQSVLFNFDVPAVGSADALDYAGVNIWVGAGQAVDSSGAPTVTGPNAPLAVSGLTPGQTYWFVSQTYDSFGAVGCPVTAAASFLVPYVTSAEIDAQVLAPYQAQIDSLGQGIALLNGPASTSGSVAAQISAEAAARITADQQTLATSSQQMTAQAATLQAHIDAVSQAQQTTAASLATTTNTLTAALNSNAAAQQQEATTRATADAALSQQISTVVATTTPNPNLCPDLTSWTTTAGVTIYQDAAAGLIALISAPANGASVVVASPRLNCQAGYTYTVTGDSQLLFNAGGGGEVYIQLLFYDANSNYLGASPVAAMNKAHSLGDPGTRAAHVSTGTAPANAVWMIARCVADVLTNVNSVAFRQIKVEWGTVATLYTQEGQLATATAAVQTETQARINADNALSSSITALSAQVSNNTAATTSEASARATADNALSTQIATVQAQTSASPNLCPDISSWILPTGMSTGTGAWGLIAAYFSPPSLVQAYTALLPCAAGYTYTITGDSAMILSAGGSGQVYFDLLFYDANGNQLPYGGASPITQSHYLGAAGTRAAHATSVQAPSNAVTMRARFIGAYLSNVSSVAFRQVKVELGAVATVYTQEGQVSTATAAVQTEANARTAADNALSAQIIAIQASTAASPNLCPDVTSWSLPSVWAVSNGIWGLVVEGFNIPDGTYVANAPMVPAAAGLTYTLSADCQYSAKGGVIWTNIEFFDGSGTLVGYSAPATLPPSFDFGAARTRSAMTTTTTAPSGTTQMRARFVINGGTGIYAAGFRQVKLERGSVATLYTTEGQTLAQAQQITTLQSTAGVNTASIQTLQSTVNGLSAQWTIKTDVNGYVAGMGLANSGNTSSLIIRADTLALVPPNSTAAASPFVVSGGQVVMNTAFIQNLTSANIAAGSISGTNIAANTLTAAHFNIAQLSAISANLGTVTAGVVQNAAGSAKFDLNAGQIVFNNGSVMKVQGLGFGSSNQFLEWFGPTQSSLSACTEANAISYLKTNGAAYFGGALSAGTLTTSRSTSNTSASAMVETPQFGSNGHTITVTLSFSYSATLHQSMTSTTQFNQVKSLISPAPTSSDYEDWYSSGANGGATIQLYRAVNGGGYSLVATLSATGGWHWYGSSDAGDHIWTATTTDGMSGSLTYTDPQLIAQPRQYKAVMTGRSPYLTIGGNVTGSQMITVTCVEQ